jgi:hypothetical protein
VPASNQNVEHKDQENASTTAHARAERRRTPAKPPFREADYSTRAKSENQDGYECRAEPQCGTFSVHNRSMIAELAEIDKMATARFDGPPRRRSIGPIHTFSRRSSA